MVRLRLLCFGLLLCSCASLSVADVRKMGQRNQVDELMEAWDQAKKNNVRAAVLDAFALNPKAQPGRRLVLSEGLSHSSKKVRVSAVRALKAYEGEDVTKALLKSLSDPFPEVREVARVTLAGKSKSAEVVAQIMETAQSGTNHLARAACFKLLTARAKTDEKLKMQLAALLMKAAKGDDAPKVREAAAMGLGVLEVQKSRSLLNELGKSDADSGVRMAAQRAVQQLDAPSQEGAVVVAVLPLKDKTNKRMGGFAGQTAEYLAAKLSGAKVCQVVDREKVEAAIQELKKMGREIYDGDAPNAPEIGSFKLANQLVYGSISKQGLVYTIVLNRMDISTLELVPGAAVTVSGYKSDLEQLKVQLADRFIANFR